MKRKRRLTQKWVNLYDLKNVTEYDRISNFDCKSSKMKNGDKVEYYKVQFVHRGRKYTTTAKTVIPRSGYCTRGTQVEVSGCPGLIKEVVNDPRENT